MYLALFNVAGLAMLGWLLLILLPAWRVTRWVAETAVFPVFLSLLYLAGIAPLMVEAGPGIMREFGTAEGVLRLLADPDVALIAWIHILAFDQAVALLIYRDNLRHRYVSLPVQSIILFFTLMFGPVGFLAYWGLRALRRGQERARAAAPADPPIAGVGEAGVAATLRAAVAGALRVYRRERVLAAGGIVGLALAAGIGAAILLRGSELVAPEGHLRKAMAFDGAVGIYLLSIALLTPLAGFTRRGLRAWQMVIGGIFLYSFTLETVQIARGIDPRFTRAGTEIDQMLGGIFFLAALGMIGTFAVLAWKLATRPAEGEIGPLVLAARWGALATFSAFGAGLWMSAVNGAASGEASILPLHAAGFHGLQAIPFVALVLAWARTPAAQAKVWVHAAGAAWMVACGAIAWQTAAGHPLPDRTPAAAAAAAALLVWALIAAAAAVTWLRRASAPRPAAAVAA